ncbi:MAG: hypothetical protein ACT4TC_17545 [Myxococcaceae bacterium]
MSSAPLHPYSSRGFSLIEMLVAGTVVTLVVAGALLAFQTQTNVLQAMETGREANSALRESLMQLETNLRRVGWGVPPTVGLDFTYRCITSPSQQFNGMAPCRDRTDGPDELAFVARSPRYRWRADGEAGCTTAGGCFDGAHAFPITADTVAGTISFTLAANSRLEKGRLVLATCANGEVPVLLTSSNNYTAGAAAVAVTLVPAATFDSRFNNTTGLQACHNTTGAAGFFVDRFRYFVQTHANANGLATPWLMLDTGVDVDGDGNLPDSDPDDLIPVARSIEDFQVAYILQPTTSFAAPDASTNNNWVLGDDKGSTAPDEPSLGAASPTYATTATDSSRFTRHPANVRAIRLSLIARTSKTDSSEPPSWTGDVVNAPENHGGTLSGNRFHRYFATAEVDLRNLESTGSFVF